MVAVCIWIDTSFFLILVYGSFVVSVVRRRYVSVVFGWRFRCVAGLCAVCDCGVCGGYALGLGQVTVYFPACGYCPFGQVFLGMGVDWVLDCLDWQLFWCVWWAFCFSVRLCLTCFSLLNFI